MKQIILLYSSIFLFAFFSCKSGKKQNNSTDENQHDFPESYIDTLESTLMENSGIIYWNKMLWTFNDSGGKNELYGLNRRTGEVKITLKLENATNVDWEDIAQDKHYIYIAETGNNLGNRTDLKVYKLKKKDITKDEFQNIEVEEIRYQYTNQTNFINEYKQHNFDSEGLIAFNDTLYLFTKDWVNYKTKVYAMPTTPGEYSLNAIDSFNVEGLITGADINAKGKLALIGYYDFKSFVWIFEKSHNQIFCNPKRIDLGMLKNAQPEGICFDPRGNLLFSCEYTESYPQQVWRIKSKYFK